MNTGCRVVSLVLLGTTILLGGCVKFLKLGSELAFMAGTYVVSVNLENGNQFPRVHGLVVEWDKAKGKVLSFDRARVGNLGVFAFFVKSARNQYATAFSDTNGNELYDPGEPAWVSTDADGRPVPMVFDAATRHARATGRLTTATVIQPELVTAGLEFKGKRTIDEATTGLSIPIALGDLADLDDPRFSSVRGEQGLWQPASFPRKTGVGIYFLEPYDPGRIPVLFVYGAAGSPQDWRTFFATLDRTKYQSWFFLYPSGRRLDASGEVLNSAIEVLQGHLGFTRLHVVAHSMGGLVSRAFLAMNVLDDHQRYVRKFVSISTPWGGHEAAAMGVKFGPVVVPSWRDMVVGSDFQKAVLARPLKGSVDHLLIYGTYRGRSLFLPHENDGAVSVASQLAPAARADAVKIMGFHADHVGILSRPDVERAVEDFLADGRP
jgi:pimeloyl-ACP methyl ester carboxylesterase